MIKSFLRKILCWVIDTKDNPYHPFVWINGNPQIGKGTYIGGFSEVYAKGANVKIGENCDIASFVVINCADSHQKTVGLKPDIEKMDITIEDNVFIGTQSAILGGTFIGHHSVIGTGCVLKKTIIPPYSMVGRGSGTQILKSYIYEKERKALQKANNRAYN